MRTGDLAPSRDMGISENEGSPRYGFVVDDPNLKISILWMVTRGTPHDYWKRPFLKIHLHIVGSQTLLNLSLGSCQRNRRTWSPLMAKQT